MSHHNEPRPICVCAVSNEWLHSFQQKSDTRKKCTIDLWLRYIYVYIFLIFGQIVTNRSFFLCTVLFWYDSLSFGVMYIVTSTITFPAKVNIYIQSITLSFHRFCHCCCRSISPNALTAHSCSPFILESYFSSLNEDSSRMGYSETHSIQFWLELVAYHGMISLIHP